MNTKKTIVENPEEEQKLWAEYKQTRSHELRNKIVSKYAPLAKYVAGRLSIGMPPSVDFGDLVNCGIVGLMDAVEKFEPDKNVKFKTYAITRIRGAIYDELRTLDWVPRSVRQRAREIEEAVRITESRLGRSATDEEVASCLKISVQEYRDAVYKVSCTSIMSLNDLRSNSDGDDKISLMDSLVSPASLNPDVIVEKEELKRIVAESIRELPEKEQKVLVLYYYEQLTLKEIGKVLDVTESRVSQLHTKAIIRLRARLTNSRRGII
ncbi:MAG: RNA polymerase sigma factor WhiG [Spirochaetia bacterium]|nr:RNA polymerase sigma factor WhiG [Spirochaetia bacterium]MBQ3713881.1 RNA polymerase sigma factor WhiG [Spirochaetia bacterium]MBQ6673345.1 RNA polymerase sigma factor WhiG [Spirochaetia bacterium]MBR0319006.1 RNA polymerase sigma factor WhiG [Spirochaetia bacterium]